LANLNSAFRALSDANFEELIGAILAAIVLSAGESLRHSLL